MHLLHPMLRQFVRRSNIVDLMRQLEMHRLGPYVPVVWYLLKNVSVSEYSLQTGGCHYLLPNHHVSFRTWNLSAICFPGQVLTSV